MQRLTCAFLLAASLLCASQAQAEQYLTAGAGWFGFDSGGFNSGDQGSTEFMGEWRGNAFFNNFTPVIGFFANTDGGALAYAGVDYDWQFVPSWYLTPGIKVGAWHDGSSIDLGGTVEFHETLELDYAFTGGYRLGAEVSHTSNAHLYDTNPGANALVATFSIPLGN